MKISTDKILGRSVGLELSLDDFQKVSDKVPFLADLKPSGKYVMEDVHKVSFLALNVTIGGTFRLYMTFFYQFWATFGTCFLDETVMIILIDWRNTSNHSVPFGASIFTWGLYDWYKSSDCLRLWKHLV